MGVTAMAADMHSRLSAVSMSFKCDFVNTIRKGGKILVKIVLLVMVYNPLESGYSGNTNLKFLPENEEFIFGNGEIAIFNAL
jgi:hypothetical protein